MWSIILTVFAIAVLFGIWVILYDTHHFVVVRHEFRSSKIKKAVRIVMLSDLHNYQYGRENAQLLAAIAKEKPDIVVLAGDMITALKNEKFDRTVAFLQKLNDAYPLYYAYGNHEQKISLFNDHYGGLGERFEAALKEAKIMPMHNSHADLAEAGISVYGLEMEHRFYRRLATQFMGKAYLDETLGDAREDFFTVLIAHNPEYFPSYAEWGADLVLSGHVHGGIVRVPFLGGLISPSLKFFPKYDGGLFEEGKSRMVLSRGIGSHKPNVRVFNPGELIVIDLAPEKK